MKKKVVVGMSGGVDSSVAATLLKEEGYDVSGVFMKIWDERYRGLLSGHSCFSPEDQDIEDAKKAAELLGIKLYIIDIAKEYSDIVLSYFKEEYLRGRTPNPCVICNQSLKFGLLLEKLTSIEKVGFDFFATGHYANVEFNKEKGRYILKKGVDKNKEQSYFLFLLTQQQLSKVQFPLGRYTKEEVRQIAERYKLPISYKEESQDFIKGDIRTFFSDKVKEGDIVDRKGNLVGRHKGIVFYTIGQRKGTGIAKGKPFYITAIDSQRNRIVVGEKQDVYRKEFIVKATNWVSIEAIKKPIRVDVKVRYKHTGATATLYPYGMNDRVKVIFEMPQWAITPGQAAVFYKGDILLGGGFIETVYR
ncbi:MAG: tRNA 2-thiouridine(34) synthase MnmA [Candidatus Omnitrophica bacterium]|nr:tRNA 2-thiouridine(34) synthase MnmA [Candidatus Omnitrophota bacterium]